MFSATWSKIINLSLYQLGWLSCILGAGFGYPLSGATAALLLVALHLLLTNARKAELQMILVTCLLGALIDGLQQTFGLMIFQEASSWSFWLPLWLLLVWAQFATLFHYALYWLTERPLLAALFGAVGGPLAYWGGIRLGAAKFGPDPLLSLTVLALLWTLLVPLLIWLSRLIDAREGRYRHIC